MVEKNNFTVMCSNASQTMSGWTFITPFSAKTKFTGFGSQDMAILAIIFAGISTTISFVNLLITRRTLSIPGLRNRKLFQMDGLAKDIDFGVYDFGTVRTLEDYERYAGVSFNKRAVQKYTLDNNIAPNPPMYGDDFDKSFLKIFKHCSKIKLVVF